MHECFDLIFKSLLHKQFISARNLLSKNHGTTKAFQKYETSRTMYRGNVNEKLYMKNKLTF